MNAYKIYHRLIIRAWLRQQPVDIYEVHHILPTALGGTDDKTNLIKLTPREHRLADILLARMLDRNQWCAVHAIEKRFPYLRKRETHRMWLRTLNAARNRRH
ncbi:MAG: HNH endonuclease [Aquabacterium sp.]|uniref:HNH endonuclease signature motif containing protein n=1 Tax=Aquabacterium sp. TaxID=1872578 RepID=UPI002716E007|nr:HNH endonuclease [Aquabacterium sp.]MDO9003603.1 HNH endonuclease [Aquabacterium sp.]